MKAEVKPYQRKPLIDTRYQAGKFILTAQCPADAYKLAALYRAMFVHDFPKLQDAIIEAAQLIHKQHTQTTP